DTFVWDPGDGSDTIEGDSGNDTMRFNGANIAEKVDLTPNGSHLLFTRVIASITMDTNGVEQVDFNALGGGATVTVNDRAAPDVTSVDVTVAGSAAAGVHVTGLAAAVDITGSEAANVQD